MIVSGRQFIYIISAGINQLLIKNSFPLKLLVTPSIICPAKLKNYQFFENPAASKGFYKLKFYKKGI